MAGGVRAARQVLGYPDRPCTSRTDGVGRVVPLPGRARQVAHGLPRDRYSIAVELTAVADLRTIAARDRAAAPGRIRPTSAQWPPFQELGARLQADGAQGILFCGFGGRTRSLWLCVFEAGLEHLRVDREPVAVISPPPPPRGLRT